jgi:tetratricopeptide (TPR) repeat protein
VSDWSDLNDEGVRLVSQGDLVGARAALEEAEAEATAAVGLAAEHAPEYLENLYTNLAILAEEAGDGQRATMYRTLCENSGRRHLGPRWPRFVELNTEGAVLASAGDLVGARAAWQAAHRETTGEVADVEALVCRAAVAGNLAGVSADYDEAARWSTEAVDAARIVLELVGDAYGTSTVLVNGLVSRAVSHHARMRLPEALADLDEAVEALASVEGGQSFEAWQSFEASVRSTRARVLVTGGWYAEAAAEARLALDLAYAAAPSLAANVHLTLAEVTSSTGDLPGAVEHLSLARDLCAATGDVGGEGTAVVSLARLAYLSSDADRADALYAEAEGLLGDDPHRLAACLCGRAAVAVLRGTPGEALELLDRAASSSGTAATPLELVAVRQVRGAALEASGEFAAAESCYAEAAAVCEAAGLWHVVLGMTWWRADALVRRAAAVTGEERRAIGLRALDLALPAALASEAVRQRFPHGPLRERWVALASAPATRSAFLAIRAVEDVALAAEYIDHIAGAVSLDAAGTPVERGELVMLPEPPAEPSVEEHLPYAASGLVSGGSLAVGGFELPPRVRLDPAVRTALDAWIDVAEERYGLPVRSERAVASW